MLDRTSLAGDSHFLTEGRFGRSWETELDPASSTNFFNWSRNLAQDTTSPERSMLQIMRSTLSMTFFIVDVNVSKKLLFNIVCGGWKTKSINCICQVFNLVWQI